MKKTGFRRIAGIFLLILLLSFPLAAKPELNMMIGNDNLTFGLAKNNDDGKSFGSKIDFNFDGHFVSASLLGMTVKGYGTEDGILRGRYDSFNLGYSYLFDWTLGRNTLSLQPYGGFNLIGNLGMEEVQNLVHRVLGKKELHLDYDYDRILFHPTIGLEAGWEFKLSDNYSLGLYDKFSYRIHFGLSNDIILMFRVDDTLSLRLGYAFAENLTGVVNSFEVQTIRDTGFIMATTVHAGIFALEFRTNLSKHLSYGLMGFNPLAFLDMESFDDHDRLFSAGVEIGYPGYMHRIRISDHNWRFMCKYIGGEITVGTEKRLNNANFSFGYDFIWELGHFSPFVSPWLGVQQYIYFKQNWVENKPDIMIEEYRPSLGCDVGLRMIEKGSLCIGGAAVSIDVGASFDWNMGVENIDLTGYGEFEKVLSPFEIRGFVDLVLHI